MVDAPLHARGLDLAAIDIGAYQVGNTGIDYVTTFDSGRSGPHVVVSAIVHGNEVCGAHALDFLHRNGIRPHTGRLTLAFMNVAAYQRFDPTAPLAARFVDEDFNRVWSHDVLGGARDSIELRRARAVRPIIDSADLLLDIHSMQHETAPLLLSGPSAKGRALATRVGAPQTVVSDDGHAAGKRMRDYARFNDPSAPQNALLVECGQHWSARARDVAIETTLRFLAAVGSIDAGAVTAHVTALRCGQRFIEVTHTVTVGTDAFRFLAEYRGMEVIAKAGTALANDGDAAVRTPYDDCVLIMPSSRLGVGQTAVRLGRYVTAE